MEEIKKEVKTKNNYNLKIEYMIGDHKGYTINEANININNPFIKIIINALDKLKICDGSWGIQLKYDNYNCNYKNKNINKLDFDLLCLVSDYTEDSAIEFFNEHNFENSNINHEYLQDFDGLLVADTEYSFLIYNGYKLK